MPELSIVIPVFNCLELTQACQRSLEETIGSRSDFEVVVVDNASTDGTAEWLTTLPQPRYRIIRNATNAGYGAASNAAARAATGRLLLFLNNDTVLLRGWLEPMLRVLERAPNAGLVGNVQREAESGLIDHAGILFTAEGVPEHFVAGSVSPPRAEFQRFPAVTGACCLISRELFLRLEGFNEAYRNGYEDVDFCLRLRRAGFSCYVANRSVIYHHISATPGRLQAETENLGRFTKTWQPLIAEMRTAKQESEMREVEWQESLHAARLTRQERRRDGWRYLKKHCWRPWRYNGARLKDAVNKFTTPMPSPPCQNAPEPFFFE